MVKLFFIFFLLFLFHNASAQLYVIKFKDKKSSFTLSTPSAYLSQKSIDRRNRYAISLDSTDLPINPAYIDSLEKIPGVIILNKSKWLNQVSIKIASDQAIQKINNYPFVQSTNIVAGRKKQTFFSSPFSIEQLPLHHNSKKVSADHFDYGASNNQIAIHNGAFLHNIGLTGEGMTIGMLDAGYLNYTFLKAFDSININAQIIDSWDFVSNEKNVSDNHPHGMYCLSIIASNIGGTFVGSSPKANFLLYRTEDEFSEYPIEEHNWVCGVERIDSLGGDVISSSLGYTTFDNPEYDHTYNDLDGNKTTVTIGADLAAKKGMLVVNAAGNEGAGTWKYISAPADGDSVMAVSAVDANEKYATFSGKGPTISGRIKPDVTSLGVGVTIQRENNTFTKGNGTSYACPNIAGLATCLWSGFPEISNMEIINALKLSANNFSKPDNLMGYGIPDVKKAFSILLKNYSKAELGEVSSCNVQLKWKSKEVEGMKYEIERSLLNETTYLKIGEIKSTGTKLHIENYSFSDAVNGLPSGIIKYKIFQIIDTNQNSFSKILIDSLSINNTMGCNSSNAFNLYPNPTKSFINLLNATQTDYKNISIQIWAADGRIIKKLFSDKLNRFEKIRLALDHLKSGKYILAIYEGEKKLSTKKILIVD